MVINKRQKSYQIWPMNLVKKPKNCRKQLVNRYLIIVIKGNPKIKQIFMDYMLKRHLNSWVQKYYS